MTLRKAITAATTRLGTRTDLRIDAGRDAELLLLHALSAPRTLLYADPGRTLSLDEQARFDTMIARRLQGEPIQYIVGEQEFYGLALKVTPAVLIPRPETELLVEAVLQRLPANQQIKIVDVGTGSGAIAISLATHLPQAELFAVDLSLDALAIAKENAEEHGTAVRFMQSDLLASIPETATFDAVVSNPPYIPDGDRDTLQAQVREFEPALALFAGSDGIAVYRRLVPQALSILRQGGLLAMEMGYGQQSSMENLLEGWCDVQFLDDLQGIARVVLARKS